MLQRCEVLILMQDSECEPLVLEDLRHARLEPGAHKAAG